MKPTTSDGNKLANVTVEQAQQLAVIEAAVDVDSAMKEKMNFRHGGNSDHDSRSEDDVPAESARSGSSGGTSSSFQPLLAASVHTWKKKVEQCLPQEIGVEFEQEGSTVVNVYEECDMNTETGLPLNPVIYPKTYLDQSIDPDVLRRAQRTSEQHISREIKQRELLAAKLRETVEAQNSRDDMVEQTAPKAFPMIEYPKANCTIRPVTRDDYPSIVTIMNLERDAQTSQILERGVVLEDIERLHIYCRQFARPFLVAETGYEDELLDSSKWPQGSSKQYAAYVQFSQTQEKVPVEVVGFAFIAETRIGTLSQPCPGSRHSGMLRLVVHPSHRRKLYGTALMDRILLTVSTLHRRMVDYKWENTDDSGIFSSPPLNNVRPYAHLNVEIVSKSEDDPEHIWLAELLDQFLFTRVFYLSKAVKTDKGDGSEWLDLSQWIHQCHFPGDIPNRSMLDLQKAIAPSNKPRIPKRFEKLTSLPKGNTEHQKHEGRSKFGQVSGKENGM